MQDIRFATDLIKTYQQTDISIVKKTEARIFRATIMTTNKDVLIYCRSVLGINYSFRLDFEGDAY